MRIMKFEQNYLNMMDSNNNMTQLERIYNTNFIRHFLFRLLTEFCGINNTHENQITVLHPCQWMNEWMNEGICFRTAYFLSVI